MRLHTALEYIRAGKFHSLEKWGEGEVEKLARFIDHHAPQTAEFSFSFLDPDKSDETLQVFIDFSNMLWDENIAPIPHEFFWVSWTQKILDETIQFAAFCERVNSETDGNFNALAVNVMFENKPRTGMGFVNQTGYKITGDHKRVLISGADSDSAALMTDNGFGVVAALLGALATPHAVRHQEAEPIKLNKHRERKGRPPIASRIVIDVRESEMMRSGSGGGGGWKVKPHWRRPTIRTLADGRRIPVSPCWVNAQGDIPPPPRQYVVKM